MTFISSVSLFLQVCVLSFFHWPLCLRVLASLHEFSSPFISLHSYLSSAKDTAYEITDGLRWSDEDRASGGLILDPAGRPVHIIWVYLRWKWSLFLLMAGPAIHKQSPCSQPDSPLVFFPQTRAGVCQWSSKEPLEIYEDLHMLMGTPCLLPTGRSSEPLFDQ